MAPPQVYHGIIPAPLPWSQAALDVRSAVMLIDVNPGHADPVRYQLHVLHGVIRVLLYYHLYVNPRFLWGYQIFDSRRVSHLATHGRQRQGLLLTVKNMALFEADLMAAFAPDSAAQAPAAADAAAHTAPAPAVEAVAPAVAVANTLRALQHLVNDYHWSLRYMDANRPLTPRKPRTTSAAAGGAGGAGGGALSQILNRIYLFAALPPLEVLSHVPPAAGAAGDPTRAVFRDLLETLITHLFSSETFVWENCLASQIGLVWMDTWRSPSAPGTAPAVPRPAIVRATAGPYDSVAHAVSNLLTAFGGSVVDLGQYYGPLSTPSFCTALAACAPVLQPAVRAAYLRTLSGPALPRYAVLSDRLAPSTLLIHATLPVQLTIDHQPTARFALRCQLQVREKELVLRDAVAATLAHPTADRVVPLDWQFVGSTALTALSWVTLTVEAHLYPADYLRLQEPAAAASHHPDERAAAAATAQEQRRLSALLGVCASTSQALLYTSEAHPDRVIAVLPRAAGTGSVCSFVAAPRQLAAVCAPSRRLPVAQRFVHADLIPWTPRLLRHHHLVPLATMATMAMYTHELAAFLDDKEAPWLQIHDKNFQRATLGICHDAWAAAMAVHRTRTALPRRIMLTPSKKAAHHAVPLVAHGDARDGHPHDAAADGGRHHHPRLDDAPPLPPAAEGGEPTQRPQAVADVITRMMEQVIQLAQTPHQDVVTVAAPAGADPASAAAATTAVPAAGDAAAHYMFAFCNTTMPWAYGVVDRDPVPSDTASGLPDDADGDAPARVAKFLDWFITCILPIPQMDALHAKYTARLRAMLKSGEVRTATAATAAAWRPGAGKGVPATLQEAQIGLYEQALMTERPQQALSELRMRFAEMQIIFRLEVARLAPQIDLPRFPSPSLLLKEVRALLESMTLWQNLAFSFAVSTHTDKAATQEQYQQHANVIPAFMALLTFFYHATWPHLVAELRDLVPTPANELGPPGNPFMSLANVPRSGAAAAAHAAAVTKTGAVGATTSAATTAAAGGSSSAHASAPAHPKTGNFLGDLSNRMVVLASGPVGRKRKATAVSAPARVATARPESDHGSRGADHRPPPAKRYGSGRTHPARAPAAHRGALPAAAATTGLSSRSAGRRPVAAALADAAQSLGPRLPSTDRVSSSAATPVVDGDSPFLVTTPHRTPGTRRGLRSGSSGGSARGHPSPSTAAATATTAAAVPATPTARTPSSRRRRRPVSHGLASPSVSRGRGGIDGAEALPGSVTAVPQTETKPVKFRDAEGDGAEPSVPMTPQGGGGGSGGRNTRSATRRRAASPTPGSPLPSVVPGSGGRRRTPRRPGGTAGAPDTPVAYRTIMSTFDQVDWDQHFAERGPVV
ncbi:hypothetical protein CXG81DRAFT_17749 [Caulochytrium protostelioides]|uniref:Uncharacterized protein n=1 Tax=Caulochytrium protostelioides TaxID=1555241 RepID=A0A4P9XBT9_9FUNG|nr:hypothetical protein CXG81DRAFT_17749 [Caulochytrium protostelioides]|eukprot:RKP02610.1 hypothetical protein CXG81DRAFT_17749 [Caulochytrium protostelioides]